MRISGNVLGEARQLKNAENLAYVNASFVRYQIPSCTMHAEVISQTDYKIGITGKNRRLIFFLTDIVYH